MRFTLRNARLIDAATDIARGAILIDGPRIEAVESEDGQDAHHRVPQPDTTIDMQGMIIMPGFIDVHTHGGGGFNLHTTRADEIRDFARWVPATGVTTGSFEGTATLTDDQAKALMNGQTYFNVHTTANPGGEVRGQVMKG